MHPGCSKLCNLFWIIHRLAVMCRLCPLHHIGCGASHLCRHRHPAIRYQGLPHCRKDGRRAFPVRRCRHTAVRPSSLWGIKLFGAREQLMRPLERLQLTTRPATRHFTFHIQQVLNALRRIPLTGPARGVPLRSQPKSASKNALRRMKPKNQTIVRITARSHLRIALRKAVKLFFRPLKPLLDLTVAPNTHRVSITARVNYMSPWALKKTLAPNTWRQVEVELLLHTKVVKIMDPVFALLHLSRSSPALGDHHGQGRPGHCLQRW
mmetsp:Transcript_76390/g.151093  ORF Transcript_76390/g.151093 Transcript_76390/m.151093 type:complete len:265 (+) Transcript_76390:1460-2254(+)